MTSHPNAQRPAHLPHGRWLGDFGPLSAAEQRLVVTCANGELCVLDAKRPEQATKANTIRAGLIRFLALGGDSKTPLHEHGVELHGAWISGTLDLEGCTVTADLALFACHFPDPIIAYGADLAGLNLGGSAINCLKADRMNVSGSVFLRDGFYATSEVRLLGASIGGDLDCSQGYFTNENGNALNANRSAIAGNCLFCNDFKALGEVRLPGANIGGDLDCSKGHFANEKGKALTADGSKIGGSCFFRSGFTAKGEVCLIGARIKGQVACSEGFFDNANGNAVNAEACHIGSSLILKGASILGSINLGAAHVRTLADGAAENVSKPPACWRGSGHILDGFIYDRIVGASDAKTRIAWLNTQRSDQLTGNDWAPQPWEQLVKVLREMGHSHEAAKVAIEKQRTMRKAGKIGKPARFTTALTPGMAIPNLLAWIRDDLSGRVRNMLHWLSGALIGHGYDVTWAIVALIAVTGSAGWAYHRGYENGYFGPTNAVIQMHYHDQCGAPGDVVQASSQPSRASVRRKKLWNDAACTPPEYTSFQPWLYSLDMILPVVNLGQDSDWAPMVMNAQQQDLWWGQALRALIIVEILLGWGLTLLIAAVMTNLIKKD